MPNDDVTNSNKEGSTGSQLVEEEDAAADDDGGGGSCSQDDDGEHDDDEDSSCCYWYFGYGPMIHPSVRQRRNINVVDEQPAILRNYRLTFAFAGVASAIKQRGYDVHGVVMKCASRDDWETLQKFESSSGAFYSSVEQVQVYHPKQKSESGGGNSMDDDDDDDFNDDDDPVMPFYNDNDINSEEDTTRTIINAHVFHMIEFDESKLEQPIETLPQERYLKLISSGMQHYNCNEEYIEDHILQVPFIPQRKPNQYLTFQKLNKLLKATILPKISFPQYQRLLLTQGQNQMLIFFVIGTKIMCVNNSSHPTHPVSAWLKHYTVVEPNLTLVVQKFVVDPDIPYRPCLEQITPEIHAWAENHMVEVIIETGGITSVYHVMDLTDDKDDKDKLLTDQELETFVNQLREDTASTTATKNGTTTNSSTASSSLVEEEEVLPQKEKEELLSVSEQQQQHSTFFSRRGTGSRRKGGTGMLKSVFHSLTLNRRSTNGPQIIEEDNNHLHSKTKESRRRRKTWAPGGTVIKRK